MADVYQQQLDKLVKMNNQRMQEVAGIVLSLGTVLPFFCDAWHAPVVLMTRCDLMFPGNGGSAGSHPAIKEGTKCNCPEIDEESAKEVCSDTQGVALMMQWALACSVQMPLTHFATGDATL